MKLSIVPILRVDERVIAGLVSNISETMRFDSIGVRPCIIDVPRRYFDQARGQYRSEDFLNLLSALDRESCEILLGLTEHDLYSPGLNFVFGQAETGGNAVISLCRLREEFYGLEANEHILLERAFKETVHEICHVLGLGHCTSSKCVMFFSNSIMDTDRKSDRLCASCSKKAGGITRSSLEDRP